MLIRSIEASDRDFFLSAVQAFYSSPAVCHKIDGSHAERTFSLLLGGTPFADCLILEDDTGSPCAYCLLARTWSNEAGGECIWLEELMVTPTARGHGVGAALIEAVRRRYPQAARFRLEVTAGNVRAAALYRRLGFTPLPYCQMICDKNSAQ